MDLVKHNVFNDFPRFAELEGQFLDKDKAALYAEFKEIPEALVAKDKELQTLHESLSADIVALRAVNGDLYTIEEVDRQKQVVESLLQRLGALRSRIEESRYSDQKVEKVAAKDAVEEAQVKQENVQETKKDGDSKAEEVEVVVESDIKNEEVAGESKIITPDIDSMINEVLHPETVVSPESKTIGANVKEVLGDYKEPAVGELFVDAAGKLQERVSAETEPLKPEAGSGEFEAVAPDIRLAEARSKFLKLLQARERLSNRIFTNTEKEKAYQDAWKEYQEAQKEALEKQKERKEALSAFLASESEIVRSSLAEKFKVKESWLVRGYKKLGEMNLYNFLEKKKKDVAEKTAAGQEVSVWDRFWEDRAKELDKSNSLYKAGAKFLSVRTGVSVGLAGLSFVDVFATSKLAIGTRTAMASVGGTIGSRATMDMVQETVRRRQLGYEGDVFASEEEARTAWSERLKNAEPGWLKRKAIKYGKKIGIEIDQEKSNAKKAEKRAGQALVLDGTPAENLRKIEEVVSSIEAYAIVNQVDLQKDAYYQKLLKTREAIKGEVLEKIAFTDNLDAPVYPDGVYDVAAQLEAQKQGYEMTAKNVRGQKVKRDIKRVASVVVGVGLGFFRAAQMLRKAAMIESVKANEHLPTEVKDVTEEPPVDDLFGEPTEPPLTGTEERTELEQLFKDIKNPEIHASAVLTADHIGLAADESGTVETPSSELTQVNETEVAALRRLEAGFSSDENAKNILEEAQKGGQKLEELLDNTLVTDKSGHNSITALVARQLESRPEQFGFNGDLEDKKAVTAWARRTATKIAKEQGFINKDGTSTGLKFEEGKDSFVVLGKSPEGEMKISVLSEKIDRLGHAKPEGAVPLAEMAEAEPVKPMAPEVEKVQTSIHIDDSEVAGAMSEDKGVSKIGEVASGNSNFEDSSTSINKVVEKTAEGDRSVTTSLVEGSVNNLTDSELRQNFLADPKFNPMFSNYMGLKSENLRMNTFNTELKALALKYSEYSRTGDPRLKEVVKHSMERLSKNVGKTPAEFFNQKMFQEFGFAQSDIKAESPGGVLERADSIRADVVPTAEVAVKSDVDISDRVLHGKSSSNVSVVKGEGVTTTISRSEFSGTLVGTSGDDLRKAFLSSESYMPKETSHLRRQFFEARLRSMAVQYSEYAKKNDPVMKNSIRQSMLILAREEGKKPGELFNTKMLREFGFEEAKPKVEEVSEVATDAEPPKKGLLGRFFDSLLGKKE